MDHNSASARAHVNFATAGLKLRKLAVDFETELIDKARLAPAPVCLTWQFEGDAAPSICVGDEMRARFAAWLEDPSILFIGANIAYDMAVAAEAWPELRCLIFQAYEEDRVTDVQIRQKLLDIASGCYMGRFVSGGLFIKHLYDLESLAKRCAGIILSKDEWRLSYGRFVGLPLSAWPDRAREVQAEARVTLLELTRKWAHVPASKVPAAVKKKIDGLRSMIDGDPARCTTYPLEDAKATLAVYLKQETHESYLKDQFRQARAYFALHLSSAWGLKTDEAGIEIFRRETAELYEEVQLELIEAGLVRPDGSKDTKAAKKRMIEVCAREGITLRRTEGHSNPDGKCKLLDGTLLPCGDEACEDHVQLDEDACHASEDDLLIAYAEYTTLGKVLNTDVAQIASGVLYPIHTKYGLAETGRTTSSKPNIQNIRRRPGLRELYIPRPNHVFYDADFPSIELYTLAQVCVSLFGFSKLADALNAGMDPHLWMAASMLGITYKEAAANKKRPDVKQARQLSKAANFGFPGGMGIAKFVTATKKAVFSNPDKAAAKAEWESLGLTIERAKELKEQWLETWPEIRLYFEYINGLCGESGKASLESLFTERFRGGASFCSACNFRFQGLASDIGKLAMWLVAKAQYTDPTSPLYNARTVAFIHDQLIGECRDDERAHDVAHENARIMVEAANTYLPDVPIKLSKMEPLLMKRMSKNAEPTFDARGRLVAWAA